MGSEMCIRDRYMDEVLYLPDGVSYEETVVRTGNDRRMKADSQIGMKNPMKKYYYRALSRVDTNVVVN